MSQINALTVKQRSPGSRPVRPKRHEAYTLADQIRLRAARCSRRTGQCGFQIVGKVHSCLVHQRHGTTHGAPHPSRFALRGHKLGACGVVTRVGGEVHVSDRATASSDPRRTRRGVRPFLPRAPPRRARVPPDVRRVRGAHPGRNSNYPAVVPDRASPAASSRSRNSLCSSGDGSHCAGSGKSSSDWRSNSLRKSGVVR